MATAKDTQSSKLTAAQLKKKVEDLEAKLQTIKEGAWCYLCDTHKARDKFYVSTDPWNQSGITPIGKDCAKKLALSSGKDKVEHEPTKESVQKALYYLNKPFLETVWNASIQESENLVTGKCKENVWTSYIKNVSMKNYVGMGYMQSDMFKEKIVYEDEKVQQENKEEELSEDVVEMYKKNKKHCYHIIL